MIRLNLNEDDDINELFANRLFFGRLADIGQLRIRFQRYVERHLEECEDENMEESNNNPNFMNEKDMNYKLYPFYINWKKIEANELGYYRILLHFGYFGASIYSTFKEKYTDLTMKNIFHVFSTFISEYLVKKDNVEVGEESKKIAKEYIEKLPNIDEIFLLIKKKILMFKEVPVFIMILKIYEIYYFLNKCDKMLIVLKSQFLLCNYLTDNEYKDIYNGYFKGKASKTLKKLAESNGKSYELPKTKSKYLNHIKSIYKELETNK